MLFVKKDFFSDQNGGRCKIQEVSFSGTVVARFNCAQLKCLHTYIGAGIYVCVVSCGLCAFPVLHIFFILSQRLICFYVCVEGVNFSVFYFSLYCGFLFCAMDVGSVFVLRSALGFASSRRPTDTQHRQTSAIAVSRTSVIRPSI